MPHSLALSGNGIVCLICWHGALEVGGHTATPSGPWAPSTDQVHKQHTGTEERHGQKVLQDSLPCSKVPAPTSQDRQVGRACSASAGVFSNFIIFHPFFLGPFRISDSMNKHCLVKPQPSSLEKEHQPISPSGRPAQLVSQEARRRKHR